MVASTTIKATGGLRFRSMPLNRPVLSASTGVLFVYLFAGLPVQIGMLTQLGLTGVDASNWFFITWMTTGLFSLVVALTTRLPMSINLSIPALIFLGGAAGGFTLPEILGANLAVGIAAVLISLFRLTDAFARVVPAPVAMAVFAGSIFSFMSKTSQLALTRHGCGESGDSRIRSWVGRHPESPGGDSCCCSRGLRWFSFDHRPARSR